MVRIESCRTCKFICLVFLWGNVPDVVWEGYDLLQSFRKHRKWLISAAWDDESAESVKVESGFLFG